MSTTESGARTLPALFFDAECPLCTGTARFIRTRDRRGTLRIESLQGTEGRALFTAHPALAGLDTFVWLEATTSGERTRVHSDAALAVATYLGGGWRVLGVLGRIVPGPIRDAVYRLVARHRPRHAGCALPR